MKRKAYKRTRKPGAPVVKNPVARSPVLGKGGAHGRSAKAERARQKRSLAKDIGRLFREE